MKYISEKIRRYSSSVLCCLFAVLLLNACGGPSREEVSSLGSLIEEFRSANEKRSQQLATNAKKLGYSFILEGYEIQLQQIKSHRAKNQYKGKIKEHLDTMENGLSEGIKHYKAWIDAGFDGASKPAPDEVTAVNAFAIDLTEAETALTIIAGK